MADAFSYMHGGSHYKELKYEPFKLISKAGFGAFASNVIRYAPRHQFKNGAEDIKKAIHYCELQIQECHGAGGVYIGVEKKRPRKGGFLKRLFYGQYLSEKEIWYIVGGETANFCSANGLKTNQADVMMALAGYEATNKICYIYACMDALRIILIEDYNIISE